MAHLGEFKVNTNGRYQKLSEITGITLEANKTYLIQSRGEIIYIASQTEPTQGGFFINDLNMMSYTQQAGSDLYVRTSPGCATTVNIAE